MSEILKMFDLNEIMDMKLVSSILVVVVALVLGLKHLIARNAPKSQQQQQHQQQQQQRTSVSKKTKTTTTHAQKKKSAAAAPAAVVQKTSSTTPPKQQQQQQKVAKVANAQKPSKKVEEVKKAKVAGKQVAKIGKLPTKKQPKTSKKSESGAAAASGIASGGAGSGLEAQTGGEWQTVRSKKQQKKGHADPLIQAVAKVAANAAGAGIKKTSNTLKKEQKKLSQEPQSARIEFSAIDETPIGDNDWESTSKQPKTKRRALRE